MSDFDDIEEVIPDSSRPRRTCSDIDQAPGELELCTRIRNGVHEIGIERNRRGIDRGSPLIFLATSPRLELARAESASHRAGWARPVTARPVAARCCSGNCSHRCGIGCELLAVRIVPHRPARGRARSPRSPLATGRGARPPVARCRPWNCPELCNQVRL